MPITLLFPAPAVTPLKRAAEDLIQVDVENRSTLGLPLVDEGKLAGAITADDVIAVLRYR